MSNPIIADNKPVKVTLAKGQEYHFCTCGRSKSQPFCDGSHVGTSCNPKVIVADEDGVVVLPAGKAAAYYKVAQDCTEKEINTSLDDWEIKHRKKIAKLLDSSNEK